MNPRTPRLATTTALAAVAGLVATATALAVLAGSLGGPPPAPGTGSSCSVPGDGFTAAPDTTTTPLGTTAETGAPEVGPPTAGAPPAGVGDSALTDCDSAPSTATTAISEPAGAPSPGRSSGD